jgi:hypothetical protein
MKKLILIAALSSLLAACHSHSQTASTPATAQAVARITIPRDSVAGITLPQDANQSYNIYYPSAAPAADSTTIIICFDPHGDGRLPIDKYRRWADKYKMAIAGSNSSRNGLSVSETQQIAGAMIDDINSRLGFDRGNMALCGFSGGAKVALTATDNAGVYNVIYIGAATGLSGVHPLHLLGFAGQQDMNYTDLLEFYNGTLSTNPNSAQIEFGGKHEWPDTTTFQSAFYWAVFNSKQKPDTNLVHAFIKNINTTITKATKQNDWLTAYDACHTAYIFLNGLADISPYKKQMDTIAGSDAYKKALTQKNQIIQKEAAEKQMLIQAFQNQGMDWWAKVIAQYKASARPTDKRLLGFISLASFSYSNQVLQQHNTKAAEQILAIYELCDPTNTDQLYFHAVLYAQENNAALAEQYLTKAVANGFKDRQKIEAEPAFTALRNDPGFARILASLKNAPR